MPGRLRDPPPSKGLWSSSPSFSWRGSKRRSGPQHRRQRKQGRVCSNGRRSVDAGMLDLSNPVATLPQAPQHEAGPASAEGRMEFVVDETGLAAGKAVAHQSGPQQEIGVGADARQSALRSVFTTGLPSEERALTRQTVPVVEDAIQHEVHKSQLMQFKIQIIKEEKLNYVAAGVAAPPFFPTKNPCVSEVCHIELPKLVEDYKLNIQQGAAEEQAAAGAALFRHNRGGKPNSNTLSKFLLAKKNSTPISYKVPENYTRPPHPYDVGKVSQVNICPVCEKCTVTELDCRPGTSDEALRARFKCGLCGEVFDLGITPFDPWGIPGVTLYEGEDRFRPPVPPLGTYPCPRCWKTTDTSFQCMTCYLREESKVQCEPACPAERLNLSCLGQPEEKNEMRKIIRTVIGLL